MVEKKELWIPFWDHYGEYETLSQSEHIVSDLKTRDLNRKKEEFGRKIKKVVKEIE